MVVWEVFIFLILSLSGYVFWFDIIFLLGLYHGMHFDMQSVSCLDFCLSEMKFNFWQSKTKFCYATFSIFVKCSVALSIYTLNFIYFMAASILSNGTCRMEFGLDIPIWIFVRGIRNKNLGCWFDFSALARILS